MYNQQGQLTGFASISHLRNRAIACPVSLPQWDWESLDVAAGGLLSPREWRRPRAGLTSEGLETGQSLWKAAPTPGRVKVQMFSMEKLLYSLTMGAAVVP
jgi:hypothetical protein